MKSKHDIIWLENIDSTNNEARRHISTLDNLSVVSALSQKDGRGQQGNSWLSEAGKNLLFSVVLRLDVQAYDQFVISQMASLAVIDLLGKYDIEAKIKWPNDIYVGDMKICGILIENAVCGKFISHSIVGIGLNVNQKNFDISLPNPTSMILSCPTNPEDDSHDFNIHNLLDEYIDILSEYIDRFCHITGGYNRLNHLYLAQMWRKDVKSEFIDNTTSPPSQFTGIIRGISDIGLLSVETTKGELKEFAFKDISYII